MRTLEDNLKAKNTWELEDLCVRLGIPAADGLPGTKAETVRLILQKIAEGLPLLPAVLGGELLDELGALTAGPPNGEGGWTLPLRDAPPGSAPEDLLLWLSVFGLAHRGRALWEILPEAAQLLPEEEAAYLRFDELGDDLFRARKLLNIYGMLPEQELARMTFGRDEEEPGALSALLLCWGGAAMLFTAPSGDRWLVSELCEEPGELYDVLSKPLLTVFPLYVWPERLFLESDFVIPFKPEDIQYLTRLARERSVDILDMEDAMSDACADLQAMNSEGALDRFRSILGEMDSGAAWLVGRCLDRVPLWVFKGRSREGMLREYMKENTPVHPAAPCPCGSGKPWGMCHGKMS